MENYLRVELSPISSTGIYWTTLLLVPLLWVIYQTYLSPLSKFPGPFWAKVNPLWQLCQYLTGERHKIFMKLHHKYGDIVRIGINELSVCHLEAQREIYGQTSVFLKVPAYKTGQKDFQYSSLATETDPIIHSKLRKQLSSAFSTKALDSMEIYIKANIDIFCASIRKRGKDGEQGLDICKWINFLTLDIFGDLCFGKSFRLMEDEVVTRLMHSIERFIYFSAMLLTCPGLLPLTRLVPKRLQKGLMQLSQESLITINERIANPSDRKDLFYYITDPERLKETSQDFADRLHTTCEHFLVAGGDTTSTVLNGAVFLLATNHEVLEKLHRELVERFPDRKSDIDHHKIAGLPYLNAVIEEAMRCYPPVIGTLPRVSSQENVVAGHKIPPNCVVSIAPYAISRDPRYFTKPECFIPERWIDPEFERDQTLGKLAFQPFSLGPRGCLGRNMAYMEIRLFLAHFVLQFRPELEDPKYSYENLDQWTAFKPPLFMKFSSLKASPA